MTTLSTPNTLSKAEVCAALGLSPRTLETLVRRGRFAPPVFLGKRAYWSAAVVERWTREQFTAQEAWQPHN